ncbi:MAG: hypothetical protein CMP02_03825 [Woeseiaceae bacterium]|nr:hypothetical protein [Woeseiaceae bacterium]
MNKLSRSIKNIINFIPWVISIYVFYLLDTNLWTYETPHRGKISVIIMTVGMILSLKLYSINKKKH